MPAYSGKRNTNSNTNGGRRWNSNSQQQRDRQNDRRSGGNIHQRISGGLGMINPWESGLAPGQAPPSLMGDFQSMQSSYLLSNSLARNEAGGGMGSAFGLPNKIRRLDDMMAAAYDDQHARGLLPAPATPLFGSSLSLSFGHSRPSDIQQRLGTSWSSDKSGALKRAGSAYYPSDDRRDSGSRNYNRSRRPARSSNNNSRGNSKDNRDKSKDNNRRHSSQKSKDETQKDSTDSKNADEDISSKSESEKKDQDQTEQADGESTKPKEIQEDVFPVESLYCHICDLQPFTTKKGFIRHLEGTTHTRIAEAFHSRNAALLELLTASSKFAEMRRRDKLIRTSNTKGLPLGRIAEQITLKNFQNVGSCCGKRHKTQFEFQEHKLSVVHLRTVFEKGHKEVKKENSEDVCLDQASVETIDELVDKAKEAREKEPWTMENIPAFDPSVPFGLQFIEKQIKYRCKICKTYSFRSLEHHCLSFQHYESILAHLNREEERKMAEKRKVEEEIRAAKEKELAEQREKEKEASADDCDHLSDDERNDAEKSFDTYLKPEDEMIILDEEDEKDDDNVSMKSGHLESEEVAEDQCDEDILQEVGNTLEDVADKGGVEDHEEGADQSEEVKADPDQDTITKEADIKMEVDSTEEVAIKMELKSSEGESDEAATPRRSGRAGRAKNRNL